MAPRKRKPGSAGLQLELIPGIRQAPIPTELAPMLPTLTEAPFSHPDWLFEPKLDGIRAITLAGDDTVRLLSRRGLDATHHYPGLAAQLLDMGRHELVLDGEIVALGADGRPSFQLLQQRINLSRESDIRWAEAHIPLTYYVFDLLHFDGYDLRGAPLENRKALLAEVLVPSDQIRLVDAFPEVGEVAYQACLDLGFEGIVAKKRASRYEAGKRSKLWLKVKGTKTDDFVIGGYSQGQGARAGTFGALLVGSVDETGGLRYAAHVGSGFSQSLLRDLRQRLDAIKTDESPFSTPVPTKGRWTGAHGRPVWVKPTTVAEVKYAEVTADGSLRAPVFLRLREDKSPKDAVRSIVTPVPRQEPRQMPLPAAEPSHSSLLDQIRNADDRVTVEIGGHPLKLTNLNKPMWPAVGETPAITKRDLLLYLVEMAPFMLAHLRDRPLTTIRMPNGIGGARFFQKHSTQSQPAFLESVQLYAKVAGEMHEYFVCNNLASLVWLGQLASLEFHSSYARVSPELDAPSLASRADVANVLFDYPDFLVFDLDPYIYAGSESQGEEPVLNRPAFQKTAEVALWLKELLDGLGLPAYVKTTGKTGLHIFVPIVRNATYPTVHSIAETIASHLIRLHPVEVTTEWAVEKRPGKVFIDVNQNVRAKTVAAIFSPRSSPEAAVSMPLRWEEIGTIYPTNFTIRTASQRLVEVGDPWASILDAKRDLLATLG